MPNFTTFIKEEIQRLARKECKKSVESIKGYLSSIRKIASDNKSNIENIEKELSIAAKGLKIDKPKIPTDTAEIKKSRLSPESIAKLRAKLKLSRNQMAKLLYVSVNTVFLWEKGKISPRLAQKAKIFELKKLGKREVKKRLAEMESSSTANN